MSETRTPSSNLLLGEDGEQFIKDAIRSAYDRGYNDARNAKSVPGDTALGYRGRDIGEEIAVDVLARLRRLQPPPSSNARGDLGITKEWFERRAKAEADLEIGAGFSIVSPTDADIAQMEVLAERSLPQWAQDELARLRAALATAAEGK